MSTPITNPITSLLATARDDLRARRERRRATTRLRAELATYTSAADRAELDAVLARHDEADVVKVERIITQLRAA
jgi:hypothetical protein